MAESNRHKEAFATADGFYEFNFMPFRICNTPSTFKRMMDKILMGIK